MCFTYAKLRGNEKVWNVNVMGKLVLFKVFAEFNRRFTRIFLKEFGKIGIVFIAQGESDFLGRHRGIGEFAFGLNNDSPSYIFSGAEGRSSFYSFVEINF